MAEESERVKQHTYQLNSNLVIQRDRYSRLEIGPSNDATSLSSIPPDKLQSQFGSNIKRSAPPKANIRSKKPKRFLDPSSTLKGSVLEEENTFGYRPKTPQTKRIYDVFLNNVSKLSNGESHEIIKSCGEMLLEILKDNSTNLKDKKRKTEKIFRIKKDSLGEEKFAELHRMSKKITDFFGTDENQAPNENNQNNHNNQNNKNFQNRVEVPINFEEDLTPEEVVEGDDDSAAEFEMKTKIDGEDEGTVNFEVKKVVEVNEGEADKKNLEGGEETPAKAKVRVGADGNESVVIDDGKISREFYSSSRHGFPGSSVSATPKTFEQNLMEIRKKREKERNEQSNAVLSTTSTFDDGNEGDLLGESEEIDLREIEAYWLQRKISAFFKDPLEAQAKAQKVLKTMEDEKDQRFCENQLVDLLGFDAFDLIKLLMRNREEVVYCTKLAQCSENERKKLEEKMKKNDRLKSILNKLNRRTSTLQDRTKKIREDLRAQAASLKSQTGSGSEKAVNKELKGFSSGDSKEDEAFKKRINIDLDSIAFKQGGHTNTNKNWTLPKGSKKIQKKGYMEIYIPYKRPNRDNNLKVKTLSEMPQWTHKSFSNEKIKFLNHVQTQCYPAAFESDENMLLCAPTGAGKTVVAQLCMLREIGKHFDETKKLKLNEFKIVYIAPMKSLVREMVGKFSSRFEKYGISVKELSGDQQLSQEQIANTQLIITTPEKWDIVTRKSGERAYTALVKLLIIDEIHLLHDTRGPALEAIVARSLRKTAAQADMRLVGLSATLPNYRNVETFLRVPKGNTFFFDQEFRPCPLTQCFVGLAAARPFRQMEMMNEICFEKVLSQRKNSQQVLVFVHSRRETFNTAKFLRESADENDCMAFFTPEGSSHEAIQEELDTLKDVKLKEVLADGIAIHHAGLEASDRRTVEDLFRNRHISVLISTATLAWGVNLPAHCVVIKGTQVYSPEKGRWTELSMLDVMQMTGRAGRPGLDSYGEAFILTTQKELKYYMSLLTEQLPIESQMISKLPEILNAEIVLGTISNVREAVEWLRYTYLYVRMLSAPELYGIPVEESKEDSKLYQRRVDLINSSAIALDKAKLVHYDRKGATFQMTEFGKIAAHFYLPNETMKTFREQTKQSMTEIEILRIFTMAQEFSFVTIREEEKLELAKLLEKVPIPIKESAEEPTAKVNVLLQTYISRLKLEGFQLQADMTYVTQSAGRLLRALFTITLKKGWAAVAKKCLSLCHCVEWRMWSIESPIRQFAGGISPEVLRRIERKEFPWQRWLDLKAHEIGSFIDSSSQGKKVYKAVHSVPRVKMLGQIQPVTRSILRIELSIEADFAFDPAVHYSREPFWIFVEDVDGEMIVYHEYFLLNGKSKREQIVAFTIPIFDPLPPQYFIRAFSDRFLGSETMLPINVSSLILPKKFPPSTELLDFTAQPVSALGNKKYLELFKFKKFNAIQTQSFNTLFKSNENVLICAPNSSGKTVCAELAILRMLEEEDNKTCVYVVPVTETAEKVYRNWVSRFSKMEKVKGVALLSGDLQYDTKLLSTANIVISDPSNWIVQQRRWRKKKAVQNISLFIADEMHLLSSNKGHVFEECVSRMRYISSQTENKTRFVGLATSVANAQDLGEWIGCKFSNIFNFSPSVRPVRLDLAIRGFDSNHFEARLLSMVKPAYSQVCNHAEGKPAVVFVPSRGLARQVAADFVALAERDEQPLRFARVSESQMSIELSALNSKLLKSTTKRGVAFLHQHMSSKEKQAVSALVNSGAIQVVVAERAVCWSLDIEAFMVVVMGTKYFDGVTGTHANYPVFEVLQMLGKAARPGKDVSSRAVVFCESSRKEFLKKFLHEPFPVESNLDGFMADYLNAEIVNGTVENAQEAVDFLTWTFLYRRLHQNPNFYSLFGTSNADVSEFLSKISEDTLEALESAGCIKTSENEEREINITPQNLGHIASHYGVAFATMEIFVSMLSAKSTLVDILEILTSAEEYLDLPARQREDPELKHLSRHVPVSVAHIGLYEPRAKAHLLLQSHFSRLSVSPDFSSDREEVLVRALKLLFALVDVAASNGWLRQALWAMEICQMVTQGLWDSGFKGFYTSPLLQLPHVTEKMAKKLEKSGIENPLDFSGENESLIRSTLNLPDGAFQDVVAVANRFPNPELTFDLKQGVFESNKPSKISCRFVRDDDEEEGEPGAKVEEEVFCPRFPGKKSETWWVLLGDSVRNELVGIKKLQGCKRETEFTLNFVPQKGKGSRKKYTLYLVSDSYLGADREYECAVDVTGGDLKKGVGKDAMLPGENGKGETGRKRRKTSEVKLKTGSKKGKSE